MKLRNKRTGEIGWLYCDHISVPKKMTVFSEDKDLSANHWDYNSLAELNAEWEDYEDDELLYVISAEHKSGYQCVLKEDYPEICKVAKELGIGFETEKECQKAVERLRAWKRLKDKGFEFRWIDMQTGQIKYSFYLKEGQKVTRGDEDDLLLLFGGEE